MPIVASRSREIRRLISELRDPRRRSGALVRLRSLGARVVPHASEEFGRLDAETRRSLSEALEDVQTQDGLALKKRLLRAAPTAGPKALAKPEGVVPKLGEELRGAEGQALSALRALPPPRPSERASVSRERGEAHLALARLGSRLARKDLLASLQILSADRARLYCEAAGLIGDGDFLAPLARLADLQPEASGAIFQIASREKIHRRSKIFKTLEEPVRLIVARAIFG